MAQGCNFKIDAGPDQFHCNTPRDFQLSGSLQASDPNATFYWVPAAGLDNPNSLSPIATLGPGKYRYKLIAKGVSANLIINGDFEQGTTGITSSYAFVPPTGTLAAGTYGVGDDPLLYDAKFTCPVNSNMLIGRSTDVSGSLIWSQTISNLNIGATYVFSLKAIKPAPDIPFSSFDIVDMDIEMDGQLIASLVNFQSCQWKDYSTTFVATKKSVTFSVKETEGQKGGVGLDDISLIEKCAVEDEVEIELVDLHAIAKIDKFPLCQNEEFKIDAIFSKLPSAINTKFIWSVEGGKIVRNNGTSIIAKGSGIYKVKLVYDDNLAHCEDETEIEVDIKDDLEANFDIIGTANCSRDTITLLADSILRNGVFSYEWEPKNKIITGQGTRFAKVIEPGMYTLKVIAVSSGCEFVVEKELKGDASIPRGQIAGDTLINCLYPSVKLKALQFDALKYDYLWILPDQKQLKNVDSINLNIPGAIKLVLTDRKSLCQDTSYWSVEENIEKPKVDLGKDLTIDCKNTSFIVIPNQDFQLGNFEYQWKLPDGSTITENALIDKKVSQAGTLQLRVINKDNFCESISSINIQDLRSNPKVQINKVQNLTCANPIVDITSNIQSINTKINWWTINGRILNGVSGNSIQVDNAGKYFIEVLDSLSFCSNVDSVTIIEDKAAPIIKITNDSLFGCNDTEIIIDASASSQGNFLDYLWSGTGIINSGQGTTQLKVGSAGTFTLKITNTSNGCFDTKTVIINPDLAGPTAVIDTPDKLNCKIHNVTLKANAQSPAGNNLKYQWSSTQLYPILNDKSLNPEVTTPGEYILEVSDVINGCKTLQKVTVFIDTTAPQISLGPDQTWNCSTSQILLDIINNIQNKNYSFQWSSQDGKILGSTNQKNIIAASPGHYILDVIDQDNFCKSQQTVEIIPDTKIPLAVASSTDTLTCSISDVKLLSTGSETGNNIVYTWKDLTGNVLGNSSTTTVKAVGKYILEVKDLASSCSSSDTVEVLENKALPFVDAGSAGLLTCKNKTVDLLAFIQQSSNTVNIQWSTVSGNILSGINQLNPIVDKPGDYTIQVTDLQNGCSNTDIVTVKQETNVPLDIIYLAEDPKCVNDPGMLSILNIVGGKPNYTYFIDGSMVDGKIPQLLFPGNHTIKIIDDNGCEISKETKIVDATPISITLNPSVTIYQGDHYELKPDYSIPLTDILKFEWTPSDNLDCNNCPFPNVLNLQNDKEYTVKITDKNGCTTTATARIKVENREVWTPTTFSPNGDNINDAFFPIAKIGSYKIVRNFQVFNRWGNLVFENMNFQPNDPQSGWNGRYKGENVNSDVFVWKLEIEWTNGEIFKLMGDVTLIR